LVLNRWNQREFFRTGVMGVELAVHVGDAYPCPTVVADAVVADASSRITQ
jgi:hypothetical protein